jgi:hypothetical protein
VVGFFDQALHDERPRCAPAWREKSVYDIGLLVLFRDVPLRAPTERPA